MKTKLLWSLVLIVVFLFTTTSFSLATDINMNQIENNSVANQTETSSTTNTTSSNLPTHTSTTVSSGLPESDLGLANILNILLITVGVILILLAIAILIRLK